MFGSATGRATRFFNQQRPLGPLYARADICPGSADLILGTRGLACLPAVRIEVLEIGTRAIDFVFCPQITFRDEIARTGIAARVFDDVG
jgi:hypothetical protein